LLAELFPQAQFQGKGLLATEGVVSFPLEGYPGHVLALRSHFFEFLPTGEEDPRLAHELEQVQQYEVVLTTGGGLYRYRLGDIIEVVGHLGEAPLLCFRGKTEAVSDRFGEKLNELHVRQALETTLAQHALQPNFAMVAYEDRSTPPAYTLFIEAPGSSEPLLQAVTADLEAALQQNFHYGYCRELGQLGSLGLFRIRGQALDTYLAVCQAQGQRAGDIKPVALHRLANWSQYFQRSFEEKL
jgi:hypothetical protein